MAKQFCFRVTGYWKKFMRAFPPMTSVLGTACGSTRSCLPGTDKEQRVHEKQKTTYRDPIVKRSLTDNYFTTLWWFFPCINMSHPWVHMCCPILNPPSISLPNSIPLGWPRALVLSALLHASTLLWSSVLHMVIYMFQYYSLKSSHHLLSPTESKSLFFTSVSLLLSCI